METPRSDVDKGKMAGTTKATDVTKHPPPENAEAVWLRTKIVLSFWALVILLGVPVWWKTTSIYRAPLPLQGMLDWSEGRVYEPRLPLEISILAPSLVCQDASHVVETAREVLASLNTFSPQPIHLLLAECRQIQDRQGQQHANDLDCSVEARDSNSIGPALRLHLVSNDDVAGIELSFHRHSAEANMLYGETSTKALGSFAAEAIYGIFAEERGALANKLATQTHNDTVAMYLSSIPEDIQTLVSSRENRALKYASSYHLTFSLFTPGGAPSSWAIEEAVQAYIRPWTSALSAISNFSINTQVQPYSAYSPSIQSFRDAEIDQTLISREDLSAFINAAEWPLSPSIGTQGPTLNFVLYIPSPSEMPLSIASSNGSTSWLIPQWGGVTILNPSLLPAQAIGSLSIPNHLDFATLHRPFETFTSQLVSLLGLPSASQPQIQSRSQARPALLPLPLRLQSHIRLQTIHLHLLTRNTLSSLSRLYTSLPNIPIPATVADLVLSSLSSLESTCQALNSTDWNSALAHARQGWQDSERAFFEKSMVGQVYFPDEHKVAVYLPLLGPIGVPLSVALIREMRGWIKRWRGTGT